VACLTFIDIARQTPVVYHMSADSAV